MMKKRILILGNFPIREPIHGGQKRARAIHDEYLSNGIDTKYVAICQAHHLRLGPNDITVSDDTKLLIKKFQPLEDYYLGLAVNNDSKVKAKLMAIMNEFKPTHIQVEQVYVYLGLSKFIDEINPRPELIYSSYNVEYTMKENIYRAEVVGGDMRLEEALDAITTAEKELVGVAELVVAVSEADKQQFARLGGKNIVVAQNGIAPIIADEKSRQHWRSYFEKSNIKYPLLFVGSAHMPNWVGFHEMIGLRMGFLPAEYRIILAGTFAKTAEDQVPRNTPAGITFWKRVEPVGLLSEKSLSGLIAESSAILLPITSGGGSNLKTAEALVSQKPIVATSFAFRAYEDLVGLEGVVVADDAQTFREHLLSAPMNTLTQKRNIEGVLWGARLKPLIERVSGGVHE